jgi:threonylcarbamoyladenosine tRNA methylthiotransferase MtaB
MPQVAREVVKARAARLRDLGSIQYNKFCQSRMGEVESVLVERDGIGRTEQFVPISIPGHSAGEIVPVRATGVSDTGLIGEPIRTAA